jgi:hypothetical protein
MHKRDGIGAACATKYDLKKEEVGRREKKVAFFWNKRGKEGKKKKEGLVGFWDGFGGWNLIRNAVMGSQW